MLPEDKKRKMRYNVIAMLRESGMPAPSEKEEIMDDAELLAEAEEKEEDGEEPAVPPAPVNGPNLKPKKKKKPQSLA
jgi:hypothetical protein